MNNQADRLNAMLWKHEDLWSHLALHNPRHKPLQLWLSNTWSPFYSRWIMSYASCKGLSCVPLVTGTARELSALRTMARSIGIPVPEIDDTSVGWNPFHHKKKPRQVRDQRTVKTHFEVKRQNVPPPSALPPGQAMDPGDEGGDDAGDEGEDVSGELIGGWLHYLDPRHLEKIIEAHKNEIAAVSNLVVPGSGSALVGVFAMKDQVSKAMKGDKKAKQFLKDMAKQAANGDPDARQAMATASSVYKGLAA